MSIRHLPAKAAIKLLRFYQKTISPDHGIFAFNPLKGCRYYPTCSEYTIRAIDRHGLLRGFGFALWRVLRCNPFTQGGIDEI